MGIHVWGPWIYFSPGIPGFCTSFLIKVSKNGKKYILMFNYVHKHCFDVICREIDKIKPKILTPATVSLIKRFRENVVCEEKKYRKKHRVEIRPRLIIKGDSFVEIVQYLRIMGFEKETIKYLLNRIDYELLNYLEKAVKEELSRLETYALSRVLQAVLGDKVDEIEDIKVKQSEYIEDFIQLQKDVKNALNQVDTICEMFDKLTSISIKISET